MEAPLPGATTTTPFNPNQARSSVTSLLLISIVLFLLSGDDPSLQTQKEDTLRSLEYQQSNYTAWLNGTASNFTLEDTTNLTSPIVDAFLPKWQAIDASRQSYYTNTTGFINGPTSFYNLSNPLSANGTWNRSIAGPLILGLNQTKVRSKLGDFDWLGIDKIAGNVREQKLNDTSRFSFLTGHIDLVNSKADALVNYQLDGVHFYEDGAIYGLMEPRGFNPDLRQLSPLVPTSVRNFTMYAIKEEIDRQIRALQDRIKNPKTEGQAEDRNSITTCSFQLYAHIKPSNFSMGLMQELESETENPTGVRTVKRPPLQLDGVILSPNCAVVLKFSEAVGMQATIFWHKSTLYSFVASLCYFIILKLLVRQMEMSRTPSSIAKISRWTFAFQAIADAYSFVGHVTVGIVSESRSSLSIIAPGFLAATLFLVFEVRFSMLIHQIQGPEDAVMRAPIAPATPTPAAASAGSDQPPTLPSPPRRVLWLENTMTRARRVFGSIQSFTNSMTDPDSKFWVMILFAFLFLVQITVSPRLVLYAIGALYSFWVPQIVRNIKRGTRKALQKRYVIGTTLCRLFFPLYIFLCPGNVLFAERQRGLDMARGSVGLVQVELYDWHPPLPRPDAEAPSASLGDCAICMDDIVLPNPDMDGTKETSSLLAGVGMGMRSVYAIAPCHHMFSLSPGY
ncbi:hypothetical protein FRC06_000734 [Ceratobasidium sp. 370]|nr:hypothetical protein FRC06_000734 [Ceratobasidium sp. 370]